MTRNIEDDLHLLVPSEISRVVTRELGVYALFDRNLSALCVKFGTELESEIRGYKEKYPEATKFAFYPCKNTQDAVQLTERLSEEYAARKEMIGFDRPA